MEKYIHGLFPIWGIRFVSIVDNADTDNKGNKKSRQINGLVNEWYLEDMSDNIRSVLTTAVSTVCISVRLHCTATAKTLTAKGIC